MLPDDVYENLTHGVDRDRHRIIERAIELAGTYKNPRNAIIVESVIRALYELDDPEKHFK